MRKLRIVIVDDHAVLRSGLRLLLGSQIDMEVVGEACDEQSAKIAIREYIPDVMTVDLSMPGCDGFVLLRVLKELSPSTRLVVLTMHDDPAYCRRAIAAGADGYVPKKSADSELMRAIRSAMSGHLSIVCDRPHEQMDAVSRLTVESGGRSIDRLSERERDVLKWVAQGLTNQQIADQRGVSVKTIESYRARILSKLNLRTRAELVKFALEAGLLRSDRQE